MLKKRLIFTLLYADGFFWLSRNFRLQKVGDLNWLFKNYQFEKISSSIDELVILNVSKSNKSIDELSMVVDELSKLVLVPIAAGGGVRSVGDAKRLIQIGADKCVINSLLFDDPMSVQLISEELGASAIVASLDYGLSSAGGYLLFHKSNNIEITKQTFYSPCLRWSNFVGELYLTSVDRDGTGQGYDLEILNHFELLNLPIIMSGGVGSSKHFLDGFRDFRVSGVSTAHLFNFIGNGLIDARKYLLSEGIELAKWS